MSDAGPPPLSRLLYLADQDTDEVYELYLATFSDALLGVQKISADIGSRWVRQFGWAPSGAHVFYTVSEAESFAIELYIVATDGTTVGEPVRVPVDLATSGDTVVGGIQAGKWSPDGSKLAFLAEEDEGLPQLFVVEPGSEQARRKLTTNGAGSYTWSPDSSQLAFLESGEISLVSADGGPITPAIDAPAVSGIEQLSWSPDGSHLSFVARTPASAIRQIYLVDVTGAPSTAVRLSPAEVDEYPGIIEAQWAPDGKRLLFSYDPNFILARRLYVVEIDNGRPGPASAVSESIAAQPYPVWSPDSRWIAFNGIDEGPLELYAVEVTPSVGMPAQVNPPLPPDGEVRESEAECAPMVWSRDTATLTYLAIQEADGSPALWTSEIVDGRPTEPVRMSAPAVDGAGVACPFSWSPVEPTLVYVANQEDRSVVELFAVEAANPASSTQVNGELVLDGDVVPEGILVRDAFRWSPSGDWIAYKADQDVNERFELYAVNRSDLGQSVPISSVTELGDVIRYVWAP